MIHPSAIIAEGTIIDEGVIIEPYAYVGKRPTPNKTSTRKVLDLISPTEIRHGSVVGAHSVIYHSVLLNYGVVVCELSSIREETVIDELSIIGRCVTLNYGCYVGKRTRICDNTHITHGTRIGNDVFVSVGVTFAADKNIYLSRFKIEAIDAKTVTVHDKALIGAGASLLPGVVVGEGAVVASGAVLTQSLPAYCLATGIPAVIRDLNPEDVEKVKQWKSPF